MTLKLRSLVPVIVIGLLVSTPVFAQNWSFDARTIGLGGTGDVSNVATDMIDQERPYGAIVLPFGLLQILPHLDTLNPTKDEFDLVRAIEYAASPLHYILDRDTTDTGEQFVSDVRNARLSRDLNVYRGFAPRTSVSAEGLASPTWGKTFKVRQGGGGAFQGVYAGAGPYLSMQTAAAIDPALTAILSSDAPQYRPNSSFSLGNDTIGQAALAVTGGYRGRFALPGGGGSSIDGVYIGANFHYLRGFAYESFDLTGRLDTDNVGLLTVRPAAGAPLAIARESSSKGQGYAIDVGASAVVNHWELGVGVNGIANRIDWEGVERTSYALDNLFGGGDFLEGPTLIAPDVRVELPVDVRANAAYNGEQWTAIAEFGHGFNGTSFRGGYEQRLGRFQLRGGARYVLEGWEPTGGVGINVGRRLGLDVGAFGTRANLERTRHLGVAVSLRLMRSES